ncbi:MAG TPA: alcohol dehydrogenase catalytic domain-containing protein [Bacillota bacterium]|nr:alcohol dehydrogenase catalytic domain-containing protein [Bacillota bacterium]
MKAVILRGPNDFGLEDVDKTVCPEGGLLLKVNLVGLCGSDLRKLRYGAHCHPVILGHEVVGTIVESRDASGRYQVGDRIMPCIAAVCGQCFFCKNGMESMCPKIVVQALGYIPYPDYQGGFAEYMPISKPLTQNGLLFKIPDSMTDEEAVMIEPYTNIFNSHDHLPLDEFTNALIIGAGPVGTMHVEILQKRGIRCAVADLNEERLNMMERVVKPEGRICSAKEDLKAFVKEFSGGLGMDLVIVACSSAKAQAQSLELLRPKGHSLFFGGLPEDNPYTQLNGNLIHYKQLTIHGTYGANEKHYRMSYEMLLNKELKGAAYVDFFKLEQFCEVVEKMEKGDVLKPVFKF